MFAQESRQIWARGYKRASAIRPIETWAWLCAYSPPCGGVEVEGFYGLGRRRRINSSLLTARQKGGPLCIKFLLLSINSNCSFPSIMVLAFVGQVIYLGLMATVCLTTLISMFTPEWRSFIKQSDHQNDEKDAINSGMFFCENLDIGTCFGKHSAVDIIVVICLVFALLFELAALGWAAASLVACCVQKLRQFLFYPLPAFSGAISLFLFLAILLFALKQDGQIEFDMNAKVGQGANIGYSFFICCVSLLFSIASIAAGVWTAFFLEKSY